MMKLEPARAPTAPLVWSQKDDGARQGRRVQHAGRRRRPRDLHDLQRAGRSASTGPPARCGGRSGCRRRSWARRSIVDGIWLQGDCDGVLHAYDVRNTTVDPPELWQVPLGGCIESTPAVWKGRIYVGTRGGFVYAIGDA